MADTVYRLGQTRLIGGRGTSCDVVLLHEPYCSRVAFALEWQSTKRTFSIQSTASNPVLVNDRVVGQEPIFLGPGDCIRLGATVLKYETAE